ncbi:MAG: ATP-binding protein [Chloroflexi bacterium]|nr:ATP-binding protein [Chloroflexota bacterium]
MNAVYIALPFVQGAVALFLASLAVLSDPRDRLNIIFAGFLVALGFWGFLIFGMRDAFPDAAAAYSWERAALVAIPFSGILFYHFVHGLTGARRTPLILAAWYMLGILAAAASLAGWTATGVEERFYGFAPQLGWAFPIVLLASYPPVLMSIVELKRAIPNASDERERAQLKMLRLGVFVSVLGGTSDFIPSLGIAIYPLGVVGNIGFALITTLAVTRHRLMNLRLLLRQGLAYTLVSSFVFASYGASFGVVFFFTRALSLEAWILASAGTILFTSVFIQPAIDRVQGGIDRLFFRERYDHLTALVAMNENARDISDLRSLADDTVQIVRRAMQSDWASMALPDPSGTRLFIIADTRGQPPMAALSRTGAVASWFALHGTSLDLRSIDADPDLQNMGAQERRALSRLNAELLVPMIAEDSLTGVLILGPRLVGGGYAQDSLSFLATAADRMAVSVENARLYAQAQREADERAVIAEIGRVISGSLDTEQVYPAFVEQVKRLLPFDRIMIAGLDEERDSLSPAYVSGTSISGWHRGSIHPVNGSGLEDVVRNRASLLLGARQVHDLYRYDSGVATGQPPITAAMSVPLVSDDHVIGVIDLAATGPLLYTQRDQDLLARIGAQIAGALANARLHAQTIRLARERELRQLLDQEKRELERVNEEKNKFLSTVSHELKTPLASIMALAEVLKKNRKGNLEEKQVEHVEVIYRSGRRLAVLIDDLLDMSRIQSGQLKLEKQPFDAIALLRDLARSFEPIMEPRGQVFANTYSAEELWVDADQDRVEQIFTNLISNASKYSGEGKTVDVLAEARDGRLWVSVTDHGIGISPEDQQQLFTSFFRASNKETRSVPGTGLGLVISRSLVELHGGEVFLESEVGVGTTFKFFLPGLLDGPPASDAAEEESGEVVLFEMPPDRRAA